MKAVFEPSMKWHLIAWLLTCRDQVTVLEPGDIREELFHIAKNMVKKYEEGKK